MTGPGTPAGEGGGTAAPATLRAGRFPYFVAARALSVFGDMAAVAALAVHVFQDTGSGLALSGLFLTRLLPRLFGAFAGALSDRMDLRQLIIGCDILSAALFLVIAVVQPSYLLLLLLLLVSESAATIALPAARTMAVRALPAEARTRANGALMGGITVGFALGSAFGGLAVGLWGFEVAMFVNVATFLASAGLTALMRRTPPLARDGAAPGVLASTARGLRTLGSDRRLLLLAAGLVVVPFGAGLDRAALVQLTQQDLSAGPLGYGLSLGLIAVGALLGSVLTGRWRKLDATAKVFLGGVVIQAVGHFAIGVSPWFSALAVATLMVGFGNGIESVCGLTLMQQRAPAEMVGVVMGVVMSATFLADALGSMAGGPLLDLVGARWTFMAATGVMVLCLAIIARSGLMRDAGDESPPRAAATAGSAAGPAGPGKG
ncbi:MFS transporter [Streptomyces carpaticus]|uniref:MFS transporter n=1 Tax=Streptomyces TaxID=1883 RepID=UPI0021FEA9EC|nr:MFS transporter [Streptomyces carpaticus]